jgi:hypothetical protein
MLSQKNYVRQSTAHSAITSLIQAQATHRDYVSLVMLQRVIKAFRWS